MRRFHLPALFPATALLLMTWSCSQVRDWSQLKQEIRTRFPEVSQLSVDELDSWLSDPAHEAPILVDARPEVEFQVSHLQGARRATTADELLALGITRDQTVVVYCSVGYRSSRLASELLAAGFAEVYNLEGSIFEWANQGKPVFRGNEAVQEVHPYDEDWGQLLDRSRWDGLGARRK